MPLEDQLFTSNEIENFYQPGDNTLINEAAAVLINEKIANRRQTIQINHIIECSKFDTVYFTSDIHSDLRKFVQMLQLSGLVRSALDPYNGDDIYNPNLITDMEWIAKPKTILVIIGDLVDGKRGYGQKLWDGTYQAVNSPDDNRGSFELLLHTLLYNLRIKANMGNSEILYTLGNHEHKTIIDTANDIGFYKDYVTDKADKFLRGYNKALPVCNCKTQSAILMPNA